MNNWGLRYGELVERWAHRQPHRPAITYDGETLTYGQLGAQVRRLAGVLRAHGAARGDRVLGVSENRPEMLVLAFACSRIGAAFVPVNPASTPDELGLVLADATPSLVCVGAEAKAVTELSGLPPVLELDGLDLASGDPSGPAAVAVDPDDVAVICYTSGTTGRPKGVVLTHRSLHWNSVNTLLGLDFAADDVALVNAPLFHTGALNMLAVNTLYKGATLALHRRFDVTSWIDTVETAGVTITFAVPTMLALLERSPAFTPSRLNSLRWILSGGAPLPPDLAARWAAMGVPVLASFGLSEAGPSVTFRRTDDVERKASSSGPPAPLTDIRILDPAGNPVPDGTVGEIVVAGPHVAAGYWNNPEATQKTFRSDGLRTGDRGFLDPDGDLVVVGRIKDTIITGGENVDPVEVEQALLEHEAVAEAVVIGLADAVWGERVTAVVVPAAGAVIGFEEARDFLSSRLARFKLPRQIEVWTDIPRTKVGKIRRSEIAERLDGPRR